MRAVKIALIVNENNNRITDKLLDKYSLTKITTLEQGDLYLGYIVSKDLVVDIDLNEVGDHCVILESISTETKEKSSIFVATSMFRKRFGSSVLKERLYEYLEIVENVGLIKDIKKVG